MCVCRQLFIDVSRSAGKVPANMTLNLPSPLVAFFPSEIVASKVDIKIALTFDANGCKHIVILSRKVNSSKRSWEAITVISVE